MTQADQIRAQIAALKAQLIAQKDQAKVDRAASAAKRAGVREIRAMLKARGLTVADLPQ